MAEAKTAAKTARTARKTAKSAPKAQKTARKTVKCEGFKGLNVRKEPGFDAEVVKVLEYGEKVDVSEEKLGWSKVDGGWCLSSHLA